MDKYLVISRHTTEDCTQAVKHFAQHHAGFLTHFEWGCYDNDHSCYAFLEADSHENALLSVPPLFREHATAIKMTTFSPKDIADSIHKKA